jgi:hypothetical protein
MKKIVIFPALLFVLNALAAPFCVVTSYGNNCYYFNFQSCQQAADQQRSVCVVNQDEAQPAPRGGPPFCVVTSYGTNCYYYDANSCRQAASQQGGACVVNPNR